MTIRTSIRSVLVLTALLSASVAWGAAPVVRSRASGNWSAAETWDAQRAPKAGDVVFIAEGHHVNYDVSSTDVIRMVQIAGELEFARDRDTLLEVGLIKISPGDDLSEEGFDCHEHPAPPEAGRPRPALLVGTSDAPIPADKRATIRLHYIAGMNAESCPAIVDCGGRMEFHGAPLTNTWVKLNRTATRGSSNLSVSSSVEGWKEGDLVIVTSTHRRRGGFGNEPVENTQTEERRIAARRTFRGRPGGDRTERGAGAQANATDGPKADVPKADASKPDTKADPEYAQKAAGAAPAKPGDPEYSKDAKDANVAGAQPPGLNLLRSIAVPPGSRGPSPGGFSLQLSVPLEHEHHAEGDYRGEVANLSRNVVIESADPNGVRGHTMYHLHSTGSISYAEFRHLGKRDLLGRYAIHFHQIEDSMRGSFVKGVSIWDSHNRWITLHGSNYLIVRDCVGYKSIGHGFFLEDGTETFNVLDHNLAVMALAGKPLPKQVLPFDENKGAGFWWANCQNTFSNNVSADCAEYGYRFEVKRTSDFNPVLQVLQADGSRKAQDVRVSPFVKFENNEAHSQRFFGLNLRGISRPQQLDFLALNDGLAKEGREAQPDQPHPFWVRNFRAWDTEWAFHSGTAGVFLDSLDAYRCEYGIWRSVIDRHTWRNITMREIFNKDLHMPFSLGMPESEGRDTYFRGIPGFVDNYAPTTVITQVVRNGSQVLVRGATSDCSAIKRVVVNDRLAYSTRGDFDEWEVSLDAAPGESLTLIAGAEDVLGNLEERPHRWQVEPSPEARPGKPTQRGRG